MKSGLWTVFAAVFGFATFAAVVAGIHAAKSSDHGAHNSFSVASGIGDAVLWIAFIAAFALATRSCWRRAERARGPHRREDSVQPRRPWER